MPGVLRDPGGSKQRHTSLVRSDSTRFYKQRAADSHWESTECAMRVPLMRNASISGGENTLGRRFSLEEPPIPRGRSRSQPPPSFAIPLPTVPSQLPDTQASTSAPHMSECLAQAALQNALASCAMPTIRISQEASQGESAGEETHPILPCSQPAFPTPSQSSPVLLASTLPPSALPQERVERRLTDVSDSVESEPEKITGVSLSAESVCCPMASSHHLGHEVANAVYALPIDTVFTFLFTNSKFMLDLHAKRKTYDVVASPWQSNPDTNQKIRQVTYSLTLPTNSFGPKVSHVTETQVISAMSKPSELYTVDAEASNSGIPYADAFYVSNHWCLTREEDSETRLAVWSQVKYKKNVWGFMKAVIDKNALAGMEGLMQDVNSALALETERANVKRITRKRHRRRAHSKGSAEVVEDYAQNKGSAAVASTSADLHKPSPITAHNRKLNFPSQSSSENGSWGCNNQHSSGGNCCKWLAAFVLTALLALNGVLYFRLYDLQEKVASNVVFRGVNIDSELLKASLPSSASSRASQEWVKLLQQQEMLHAREMDRWRAAITEAAHYLSKAESALRALHGSIPEQQASKMSALLKQLRQMDHIQREDSFSSTDEQNSKHELPHSDASESPKERRTEL